MHVRIPSDSNIEFYTFRGPLPRIDTGNTTPVSDPIARLTRECSALRLKLATAERRERCSGFGPFTSPPLSARSPPSRHLDLAIESAYARRDAARSQLQIEIMKLAERYKVLEKTLREMQEALRTKDKEVEALMQERDRLIAERDQACAERDQEREKAQSAVTVAPREAKQETDGTRIQNGHHRGHRSRTPSRSRASARRIEGPPPPPPPPPPPLPRNPQLYVDAEQIAHARSMDVFLTKTDSWSGAQVIQAVEDLNAEINQFAASATESCTFAKRLRVRTPMMQSQSLGLGGDIGPGAMLDEENAPWLGAPFARVLAARDHTQDPILVQLALQASLTTCCARSLALFCVGFPSKLDALLSRVLTHMQSSEPQATSARWRALTHRAIRMLYPGLEEYAITELVATMLRWSAMVFSLAGSSPASEPSSLTVLSAQLRRIAEAVYKLARVTREEILSTTFEVVLVESGEAFEEGNMTNKMRDYEDCIADDKTGANSYADEKPSDQANENSKTSNVEGQRVLCTTELGLRCITRKGNKTAAPEDSEEGELFESRMLLLPKVVLNSGVQAIERGER
ncbi:uncharacterized protein FIBRA_03456 [Fibroporia radiculosa]|uniref:Uncharacterized protein n=1 Tax=Fibroporia radiculosa TaxID=599839 RepID=J4GNH6_9APHY|nr:uncharacterized protein FIBRA_03456 [Fibroporia radiculosa]CCM01405.1 predicted protein [Fibroporia radiculosa]